jgi:Flp pilus assembly protein TadG
MKRFLPVPAGRVAAARVRRRGQALAELALLLPVLLVMTVGVVDLARAFTGYVALTNGIREGVIYAISMNSDGTTLNADHWCSSAASPAIACPAGAGSHKYADPDNIGARIAAETEGIDRSLIALRAPTCNPSPCNSSSTTVTIAASFDMPVLTPVLSSILGSSVRISASGVGRLIK